MSLEGFAMHLIKYHPERIATDYRGINKLLKSWQDFGGLQSEDYKRQIRVCKELHEKESESNGRR